MIAGRPLNVRYIRVIFDRVGLSASFPLSPRLRPNCGHDGSAASCEHWPACRRWQREYIWVDGCQLPRSESVLARHTFYLLFSRHSGGSHQWGPMDRQWNTSYSALEILDERYAKGEIQKEEYQERKAVILSGRLR
jgi:hypothetical protein